VIGTYMLIRLDRLDSEAKPIEGTFTQLTHRLGEERFPSLSPDGDNIVYASQESGNWDIYLKRVGGERVINLTEDSSADDTMPAFSPDGKHIAFRSERLGGGLFLMGATGESVRRLTDSGYNPAWSPDGKKIVYATEYIEHPGSRLIISSLCVVDVANGELQLITEHDAVQPSWSPHGHRIAYWTHTDPRGERRGERDIWTLPANGGEAVPVTEDSYADWNPVWSPDGEHLYFLSDRGGTMQLWRVPIEEETGKVLGSPQAVTAGGTAGGTREPRHLTFTQDGKRLAYVESLASVDLWKVGFDATAGKVKGDPVSIKAGTRCLGDPDISTDGNWLAYRTCDIEDICIMRADGTSIRQLTNDAHNDRRPRLSPDGKRIAFYSNRSGRHQIWAIHRDGSGLTQLTNAEGDVFYFDWSPDGSHMVYLNEKGDDNFNYIFRIDLPWNEQKLLPLPTPSEGVPFSVESWSPDGDWLAGYGESDGGASTGIVLYSLESQQYKKLTDSGTRPTWLADSRRLLFWEQGVIHLVDRTSLRIHEILSLLPDRVWNFSITSDDRWIYFARTSIKADIWMLTLNEERE
jgi:Tol biopolymer transport system component